MNTNGIYIYDPYSGCVTFVENHTIDELLTEANKLRKAKHARMSYNDLLEIFGFSRKLLGEYYAVRKKEPIKVTVGYKCNVECYILDYILDPNYKES